MCPGFPGGPVIPEERTQQVNIKRLNILHCHINRIRPHTTEEHEDELLLPSGPWIPERPFSPFCPRSPGTVLSSPRAPFSPEKSRHHLSYNSEPTHSTTARLNRLTCTSRNSKLSYISHIAFWSWGSWNTNSRRSWRPPLSYQSNGTTLSKWSSVTFLSWRPLESREDRCYHHRWRSCSTASGPVWTYWVSFLSLNSF